MKLFTAFAFLTGIIFISSGCKKSALDPVDQSNAPAAGTVGSWKLVQLNGEIDSASTVNGVKTTTAMTFSFDSLSNQSTQKVNGIVKYQYPYSLTITMNDSNTDQIIEDYVRPNAAGVSTPYHFVINSYWNYTTTNKPYDGLTIKGFNQTSVLGYYKINPATTTGSSVIQDFLTNPMFTNYDQKDSHLYLYVHYQYIGNPDSKNGGTVTNQAFQINGDYTLVFSKTAGVPVYN